MPTGYRWDQGQDIAVTAPCKRLLHTMIGNALAIRSAWRHRPFVHPRKPYRQAEGALL